MIRNPTPDNGADPLLNITWIPSGINGTHLKIANNEYSMEPRPVDATLEEIQTAFKDKECILNGCNKNQCEVI